MCVWVCVVWTFKIYSLSNFQIYTAVFLTIITVLYITSPALIHLIIGSLYPLTAFTHFPYPYPPPPHLWQPLICSLFLSLVFLDPTSKWDHTVFLCLTFSLSMIPSGFIHVVANGRISFFFFSGWIMFCCIPVHFLYSFIHQWTLRLLLGLGYCK